MSLKLFTLMKLWSQNVIVSHSEIMQYGGYTHVPTRLYAVTTTALFLTGGNVIIYDYT